MPAFGLHAGKTALNVGCGVDYGLAADCGPCGTETGAQEIAPVEHDGLSRSKFGSELDPDFLQQWRGQQPTRTNNHGIVGILL